MLASRSAMAPATLVSISEGFWLQGCQRNSNLAAWQSESVPGRRVRRNLSEGGHFDGSGWLEGRWWMKSRLVEES